MQEIIFFLVGLMTYWVPPVTPPDEIRYTHMAQDALDVAKEKDWLGLTPAESAAILLAIASYESGYRNDIDRGHVRGDGGRAVCLGQVHASKHVLEQAAKDRKTCFRLMLTKIRQSWDWCKQLPWSERLSGYTVGKCVQSATSRRYTGRILEAFEGLYEIENVEAEDPDDEPSGNPEAFNLPF